MFTLSKPYVCCIYSDDSSRKKEVNMDKKDVKVKKFQYSTCMFMNYHYYTTQLFTFIGNYMSLCMPCVLS